MKQESSCTVFRFKQFDVSNNRSAMKVGTDGVLLAAWAVMQPGFTPGRILDAGTGTGVIALIMAQRFAEADIIGIDVDTDAVHEASLNFSNSPWPTRLDARLIDFSTLAGGGTAGGDVKFDLIVSNPPFFTNGQLAPDAKRSLARHGGDLSPIALIRGARALLSPCGRLCLISTADARGDLEYEATLAGLHVERCVPVATGENKPPRRILWQFTKSQINSNNMPYDEQMITIRTQSGAPADAYVKLVEPYYLYVK